MVALFYPLWVRSFHLSEVLVGADVNSSLFSTVRTFLWSPASPLASAELTLPVHVRPWLRQGLGCPRAHPRVNHRTFSHVLRQNFPSEAAHQTPSHRLRLAGLPHALSRATRGQALCVEVSDPRARLATLSSAWSWIPPCHVWSTFARRWERLVVLVFASKICTENGVRHLSSGFALLGFPRSCTRLLWIVVFPLRPPSCSPAEALLESAYDTRSRSCLRCVWLCASWSVGTSRRRHVRID